MCCIQTNIYVSRVCVCKEFEMNIFLTYYYNSHEKKEFPTTARVLQTNLVRHEILNRAEQESITQSVVKTSFIFCETELSELDLWGVNLAFFGVRKEVRQPLVPGSIIIAANPIIANVLCFTLDKAL